MIKKINYLLLFLLVVGCWLLVAASVQSQNPEIDITLTWSTDTYVPLDYPGKALPSRGSIVEVVANIDTSGINLQELAYNWFLDDVIQEMDSGQGRQIFRFNIGESLTKRRLVQVEIRNSQGSLLDSSPYLSLTAKEPEIVLSPQDYRISSNQEIEFTAQPYFFNINNVDELNYKWRLAEKEASQIDPKTPHILTLKVGQVNQPVKQNLSVWVENKNNPIQRTQTTIEIILTP